jgi:FAD/FMN-containing dehydrogenase
MLPCTAASTASVLCSVITTSLHLVLTTGVVTAVAIQCAPKPSSVQVAFLQCPDFAAVQEVLATAKQQLGEILSAVEFLDSESLHLATTFIPGVSNPLDNTGAAAAEGQQSGQSAAAAGAGGSGPMYMVIETQGSSEPHDKEKLEAFLEVCGVLRASGRLVSGDALYLLRKGMHALGRARPVYTLKALIQSQRVTGTSGVSCTYAAAFLLEPRDAWSSLLVVEHSGQSVSEP